MSREKPRKGTEYIPDRGDAVWLTFDPESGHEQRGRRPAVVLSPRSYNSVTGLALFCPVTSKVKGYPFEVVIPAVAKIEGVILADQVRNLDWKSRDAEWICKLPLATTEEVLGKLSALMA